MLLFVFVEYACNIALKVYGDTFTFFRHVFKGREFMCAYVEDEVFPKWIFSERKEFAPMGANSFLCEMIPIYIGCNNEK